MRQGRKLQKWIAQHRHFLQEWLKKRAKDKVTPTLPISPRKKAEVVQTLADSPNTRGILEKRGFLQSSTDKQDTDAMRSIVADLTDGLARVKKAKSKDDSAAYGVARALAFGATVKKNRKKSRVAKPVGIKRQQVSKGISHRQKVIKGDEACWIVTKRKVRMDAIKEEEKRMIYDYWTHQASRPTGSKKDKMRHRLGRGEYVEHAKHVLEKTQTECFQEFQQLHPEIKIKQRKFEQFKPFFVKGARERDRQSCLCRKHVESKMLFDSCMNFRKSLQSNSNESVPVFNFLSEAVNSTLCEKNEEASYQRLECLMRDCQECGVQQFKLVQEEESKDVLVKWKRYEYINVQDKNGEERRKIALVVKETPVVEMFQYFLELLNDYTYHSFMAKWQKDQFDSPLNSLPKHHVLCVYDFSENYTCRSQDEIQSQYFDPNKVSIHVTILYRHACLYTDGIESTEDNPHIVKEHIFALSDDNIQDYHFVHHVQNLILSYLRDEQHLIVNKVHEFTDGCSAQYKSKHTFGDLSYCLADFGCQVDRHFFETSHAKGEQDAAGANVKQRATLAVLQRKVTIASAKDMFDYLSENFAHPTPTSAGISLKKRKYLYIPTEDEGSVPRKRQGRSFKELKGIQKVHSVQTTETQCKVFTRHRTCVCFECLQYESEHCENSEFVDEWKEEVITHDGQVAVTRQNQDSADAERVNGIRDLVQHRSYCSSR